MIWLVIALLSVFSLLVVYSSTAAVVGRSTNLSTLSFFLKHLFFLGIGFGILQILSRLPHSLFMAGASWGFWISLGLLVLTLAIGKSHNQAARSLFGFQPAELAKVMLIVYVARLLTVNQEAIGGSWKQAYIRIIGPVLAICGLIFLSNFSTAAVLASTCFIMMFIGRVRIKHLLVTMLIIIGLLAPALAITKVVDDKVAEKKAQGVEITGVLKTSYTVIGKTRLQTIYGRIFTRIKEEDISSKKLLKASQSDYAKIAVSSGGLVWGKGPGNSAMRYRLPEAFSDFAFAIVVEEYGVIFAGIVILCYLIVLYRVGVMAKKATHFFPTLLAIGISTQIMLQALVNMCVSTGIAPVTGQNLPFISQGGSSLLITCIMFGILLSVSRSQNETEEKERVRKAKLAEKETAVQTAETIQQQSQEELATATLQNLN